MMNGYGAAVMAERTSPQRTRALACYLAAEYGAGTDPAYVETATRRGARRWSTRGRRPARRAILPTILEIFGFAPDRRRAVEAPDPVECPDEGGSAARAGG